MNQESKGSATTKAKPKKYRYSNDYVASCALFLIDGKTYTGAHFFLLDQIEKIRSEEEEKKLITYTELAEWTCKLARIYEENAGI